MTLLERRGLATLALAAIFLGNACSTPREYFPPAEPGPPFSNAVRVGDTLYVAGHLGLDPGTGRAPAAIDEEVQRMLDAFSETLGRANMTMDNLVHVTLFCSDVSLYGQFNELYAARFRGAFPARAFIGSGQLLRGARFEITGIATR